MQIIRHPDRLRRWSRSLRRRRETVGFVPTMGALHEGHLSLIRQAKRECRRVVASLFVNPLQFGPKEDFRRYPRDRKGDFEKLRRERVDCVFTPSAKQMYSADYQTSVSVERLSRPLCGRFRPGHFQGVATVCAKLFNAAEPDRAYFGQKDFQQLRIIEQLVEDLNLGIRIRRHPIVRERDGLAMSSRNRYLNPAQRQSATLLYKALCAGKEAIRRGERNGVALMRRMRRVVRSPKIRIDYLEAVDPENLSTLKRIKGKVLLSGAIRVGKTRLIDNLLVRVS